MDYCILTLPFSQGLSQIDAASILARAVRAADPACKTENVIQYPILDGGEGTLELLVTTRLGAFLEVEAKNFVGSEIVVPLGFVGDDQSIAILRMGSLRNEAENFERCGTSYGVGELIRDALDEGAFSVVLCQDEPLAADGGLGLANALGVKFFDANDAELDLSKPIQNLFEKIARIDASNRPFELLSARIYLAQAAASTLDSLSDSQRMNVERFARIAAEGGAASHAITEFYSHSMIEFGASLFLPSEIKEGSMLVLEASMIESRITSSKAITFLLSVGDARQILESAPAALSHLIGLARSSGSQLVVFLENNVSEAELTKLKSALPARSFIVALQDAPIFSAPLTSSASEETVRRDQQMRLEKLVPIMLKKATDATAA